MGSSLQQDNTLWSWINTRFTLNRSMLQGHNEEAKQDAVDAVEILQKYKTNVHEFTEEIVNFWSLPRKIMDRYSFDDVEQLNEWLDDMS